MTRPRRFEMLITLMCQHSSGFGALSLAGSDGHLITANVEILKAGRGTLVR